MAGLRDPDEASRITKRTHRYCDTSWRSRVNGKVGLAWLIWRLGDENEVGKRAADFVDGRSHRRRPPVARRVSGYDGWEGV